MSAAACTKKILCDPSVNKLEALSNALNYLNAQIKTNYKNDPAELLALRENIYSSIEPSLKISINEALKHLE